jgi:hypothetical protein
MEGRPIEDATVLPVNLGFARYSVIVIGKTPFLKVVLGCLAILAGLSLATAESAELRLPPRPAGATGGAAFAAAVAGLSPEAREDTIWNEISRGNVPDFLRQLAPVDVSATIDGRTVSGEFYVAPDYLAVGSNEDYFLVPITPYTAQKIADRAGAVLPTPSMVDSIYRSAEVRLEPSPIPPSPAMTTVPVFLAHNIAVGAQRAALIPQFPLGALTAGDKKDIVVCAGLATHPGRVAIYGWHKPDGVPIQPLYLGHFAYWADYSHGVRVVARKMKVDGKWTTVARVLADRKLCTLLSGEGPLKGGRYRIKRFPRPEEKRSAVIGG